MNLRFLVSSFVVSTLVSLSAFADCGNFSGTYVADTSCLIPAIMPLAGQPFGASSIFFVDQSSGQPVAHRFSIIQNGCEKMILVSGEEEGSYVNHDVLDLTHATYSGSQLTLNQEYKQSDSQGKIDDTLSWKFNPVGNSGDFVLTSVATYLEQPSHHFPSRNIKKITCRFHKQ